MKLSIGLYNVSHVVLEKQKQFNWKKGFNRTKYISKIISSYVCVVFVFMDVSFPHLDRRDFCFFELSEFQLPWNFGKKHVNQDEEKKRPGARKQNIRMGI